WRMAPRKLSDADKSEIVDLYRQPGQTTSTLAEQFSRGHTPMCFTGLTGRKILNAFRILPW
ncbi:MAG: transposase, partial [Cyanobacteria bacterium J06560_5]